MADNSIPLPTDKILLSFTQALECSPVDDCASSQAREERRSQRIASNFAIVGFLTLATIVSVAELPFVPKKLKDPLMDLGAPIGMKQAWRVFAPELRSTNWHTLCIIELRDGTLKSIEFPRMQKLSLLDRFIQEKRRSFLGERLAHSVFKRFRPLVARFYARANSDATNPPVRVTFIFASAPIPKISDKPYVYRDQLPEHIYKQVYLSYPVKTEDLK